MSDPKNPLNQENVDKIMSNGIDDLFVKNRTSYENGDSFDFCIPEEPKNEQRKEEKTERKRGVV
jgi:hypothetical protein